MVVLGCSNNDDRSTFENPATNIPGGTTDTAGRGGNTGSIKVDSFNIGADTFLSPATVSGNCTPVCDRDKEDNTIAPGFNQLVWRNLSGQNTCTSQLYYEIIDSPGHNVLSGGCQTLYNLGSTCDNYSQHAFWAPVAENSQSSSAALTVYCGPCKWCGRRFGQFPSGG